MTITTNRRALLGVAGLAGTMLATPLLGRSIGANDPTADRSTWASLIADYRLKYQASDVAYHAHSNAEEAYFAYRPEKPSFVMEIEGDYGKFGKHVLPVTIYDSDLDDPTRSWKDPAQIEVFRKARTEYLAAEKAARARFRLDELEAVTVKKARAQADALDALLTFPATNPSILAEKIEIIIAEYEDRDGTLGRVLADVRNLSDREGR